MRPALLGTAAFLTLALMTQSGVAAPLFGLFGGSDNQSFTERSQASDDPNLVRQGNDHKPLWRLRYDARQQSFLRARPVGGNFGKPAEHRPGLIERIQDRVRSVAMLGRPAIVPTTAGTSSGGGLFAFFRGTIGGFANRIGQTSVVQMLRKWRNSAFGESGRFGESVQRAYSWGGGTADVGVANLGYQGWRMPWELNKHLTVAEARPALKIKAPDDSRRMIFKARERNQHRLRTKPFTIE